MLCARTSLELLNRHAPHSAVLARCRSLVGLQLKNFPASQTHAIFFFSFFLD